jgi:hypothetical protein
MLAGGILLTLFSVALVVPGAVVIGVSEPRCDWGCAIGGILVGAGVVALIAGIPLWVAGQNRLTQARRLSFAPNGLTLRF